MTFEQAHLSSGWRLRAAALSWVTAIQFYLLQAIVALGWTGRFSISERYISDLGNTVCAAYPVGGSTLVCSPWHAAMNASFIALGITMIGGSVAGGGAFRPGVWRGIGLTLLGLAGAGVILVGLYPENEDTVRHTIGAALNFIPGNLALVTLGLAGFSGSGVRWFRGLSVGMGLLGLVATALFVADHNLGLGTGGMERVAAYPQTLWQIMTGIIVWRGLKGPSPRDRV